MGADYRRAMPAEVFMNTTTALAAGQTRYFTNDNLVAAVAVARYVVTRVIHIDRIYAQVTAAAGAGESYIFTLYVNGNPSAVTVTIGGAAQVDNNSFANAVILAPGNIISMEVVASGLAAGVNVCASIGGNY